MWPLPIVVAVVNSCTQPWVEHARAKKKSLCTFEGYQIQEEYVLP